MPKDYSRTLRIAEQIHRELAVLVREGIKDPRVGMVTIGDVEVSKDLAHAKVYFTVLGDADAVEASREGLNRAAGFLRRELGKSLHLRVVPALRFYYDDTQVRGTELSALIDKAVQEDRTRHEAQPAPDADEKDASGG